MTTNTDYVKEESDALTYNITWALFENLLAELGETEPSQMTSDSDDLDSEAIRPPIEKPSTTD